MDRFTLKLVACLAFLLCLGAVPAGGQTIERAIAGDPVRTVEGLVRGNTLATGVKAYLGIPFAASPTDALRWRPPQPVRPWRGVYDADRFGPQCMQRKAQHASNHYFKEEPTSEDCLYLNVLAPAQAKPNGKAPVIAWIYGGAFSGGSAAMPLYFGEGLVRKGVVFVSFNYRLGSLGFMAHPELTQEGGGASGNYGFLDQLAALKWVSRNIAAFGGDPGNVTIMGQSAGSMAVNALQASPLSQGLFHRAIGMSGSAFGNIYQWTPLRDAELAGLQLQSKVGTKSLAEMRNIPADQIIEAARGTRSGGVIDGKFLVGTPDQVYARKLFVDVPAMIGFSADEGFGPLNSVTNLADYRKTVDESFGSKSAAVLQLYPATSDADAVTASRKLAFDSSFGIMQQAWLDAEMRSARSRAYGYVFSYPNVWYAPGSPKRPGAFHAGDLPFFLGSVSALQAARPSVVWSPTDLQVVDRVTSAVVAFARTGDPNNSSVPTWPVFGADARIMEFAAEARVRSWPDIERSRRLREILLAP